MGKRLVILRALSSSLPRTDLSAKMRQDKCTLACQSQDTVFKFRGVEPAG